MKLYVGNLSRSTTDETVKAAFEKYGEVDSVRILFDRETRQSRGFGFVEMSDNDQAQQAMDNLNDTELEGRRIRVNEAREPERRPGGGGGGGGSRFGGGGQRGGGFRSRF